MLPRIKTRIPQMEDLLQAEQAYLDVILNLTEWLHGRIEMLSEVVMNIPNLKAKIKQITGWDCEILEDAENLTLTIRYYFDAETPFLEQESRILVYIPAHLKVIHEFLQAYHGIEKLHVGGGVGNFVRYVGRHQEVNGQRSGLYRLGIQANVTVHTKMTAYPINQEE